MFRYLSLQYVCFIQLFIFKINQWHIQNLEKCKHSSRRNQISPIFSFIVEFRENYSKKHPVIMSKTSKQFNLVKNIISILWIVLIICRARIFACVFENYLYVKIYQFMSYLTPILEISSKQKIVFKNWLCTINTSAILYN